MNRIERHDWHYVPDACLVRIINFLPPSTLGSLRLVSKGWRDQVSYTLTKLALRSDCDLEALLHAFPNIGTLSFTLRRGVAASFHPLSSVPNITNLALAGPDIRLLAPPIRLSDAALAHIATMPRLTQLTLVKVAIDWGSSTQLALQDLSSNLKTLRLRGVKLSSSTINASASFFDVLKELQSLEALEIDEVTFTNVGNNSNSITPTAVVISTDDIVPQSTPNWPDTLSSMKNLKEIRLGGSALPITDELCCAVASLPKLSSLELSRPGWWGYKSDTTENNNNTAGNAAVEASLHQRLPLLTEDGGLAALSARASTLRHLALCGCFAMTSNAAVHHIAALTALTSLDFTTFSGEEESIDRQINNNINIFLPQQHHNDNNNRVLELRGPCLSRLTSLRNLERLHLGGWPVSVSTARALGRLPCLQRLEFSNCSDLDDSVLFELAKMSKLQHLALRRCVAVSDIGLAALAKGPLAQSLTALDLKGCHKNVTDQGLTAIQGLKKLQLLDLSGCELVSDLGIARGLGKMKLLQHLALSDTGVSDHACSLLSTAAPLLRVVHIEHCSRISDTGAEALTQLKGLHEVRACGSSVTTKGAKMLNDKTGAVVSLHKPCWWSKAIPTAHSTSSNASGSSGSSGSNGSGVTSSSGVVVYAHKTAATKVA